MDDENMEKIFCNICGKTLALTKDYVIYLYCKRCRKQRVISIDLLIEQITAIINDK